MEEMKHTPGPWELAAPTQRIEFGIYSTGEVSGIRRFIGDADGGTSYRESVANARLMAASPEMLEALQSLVNQFLQRGVFTDPEHPDRIALALAESAIAKATGGAA